MNYEINDDTQKRWLEIKISLVKLGDFQQIEELAHIEEVEGKLEEFVKNQDVVQCGARLPSWFSI